MQKKPKSSHNFSFGNLFFSFSPRFWWPYFSGHSSAPERQVGNPRGTYPPKNSECPPRNVIYRVLDIHFIFIHRQIQQTKSFTKGSVVKSLPERTSGQLSLEDFVCLKEEHDAVEELRDCGLTDEEIVFKLQQEGKRSNIIQVIQEILCINVTHHIKTNQLSSAICFSFHNFVSDVKYGILIVCICKNTFHGTGYYTKSCFHFYGD